MQFQVDPSEYYLRMITLVTIGLLVRVGVVTPSVRLLSATEHLSEQSHLIGTPYQLDAQRRLRSRLEQLVDPDTFAEEWAAGRAMTLDRAISLAREQLSEIDSRGGTDHA